jgi:hypothetical protein
MKSIHYLLIAFCCVLNISCDDDSAQRQKAWVAVPVVKSLAEIRSSVAVAAARQTHADGKVYVAQDYLFYIAQEEGVHVFDNSDPQSPQNIAFISLEGVHDIAVKGTYLYADNFVDLLVFDISDVNNIQLVRTVENSINFYPEIPENASHIDYDYNWSEGSLITGFRLEYKEVSNYMESSVFVGTPMASNGGDFVGTGGSFARFQINKDALYAVEKFQLNVFNIANPLTTHFDKSVYMDGWFNAGEFETLFKQKDYLFIGATNGMFIVNAFDAFNPFFVSGFSHATACDPVVVHHNTAYITVRGSSTCGAIEDQVNVLDISTISNPQLLSTFFLEQPYGLGYHDQKLFVCSGSGAIKVFDASSPDLVLVHSYPAAVTDVIALDSHLIAVGPNKIIQYRYGPGMTLEPISTVVF